MAKTKRMKTLTAGRLVIGVAYTQARGSDTPRARREKQRVSSLARQKLNFRAAWQKLWLLLCANFGRGDLWVTVTYDDEHLPTNRKEAKKRMTAFWDRMRAARKRQGAELKYIYCTQETQDDGSRRLHHHFVVNSTDDRTDFEQIRSLWTDGQNVDIRVIGQSAVYPMDDFQELARYMLHERNPEATEHATGDRGFCCSRNIVRPTEESCLVDDSVTIGVPAGAYVIERESKANEFGSFDYVCYLLPEPQPPKKKRKRTLISDLGQGISLGVDF